MKKLLIVFWCLYFSATCKQVPAQELIFLNANDQSWAGGAAGSGHGINYNFYFISKNHSITGDSVWVMGYVLPVTTTVNGDTIHLKAVAFYGGQMGGRTNGQPFVTPKKATPPIPDAAAAIISYSIGNTVRYVTAPTMNRLKSLDYP